MAAIRAFAVNEDRREARDETLYRLRSRDGGGTEHDLVVVNISPNGFMARVDDGLSIGDTLSVTLPVVGRFDAEVRWALGGRIGCRLTREIPASLYAFALAAMR
jgi:hypothetical protein